jgi:LmbE family N-acetylglucosaminyl deacetylase
LDSAQLRRTRVSQGHVTRCAVWLIKAVVPFAILASSRAVADDDMQLPVGRGERLLILAPHPDDETLGAAGLAQRVLTNGGSVRTLIVTAGDGFVEGVQQRTGQTRPAPDAFLDYGEQRIREAQRVAQVLGAGKLRVGVMGFPDGSLLPLLFAHWETSHPGRSDTTLRSSVPYRETPDRYLAYSGGNIRAAIVSVMREVKPTMIAFSDVLDEHPDHRAVGLFSLMAAADYMRGRNGAWPKLLAYVVHWRAWPPDSGALEVAEQHNDAPLDLPSDLPLRGQTHSCLTLTDDELARKRSALAEYHTQQDVMPAFLSAFVRRTECFSVNQSESAIALMRRIRQQVRDLTAKLARAEQR